ncbi:MAG TPA: hypothetical protein VNY51_08370 [Candidatus Dormibacteraeota bacterium]|nr:hypothetical protein [Candidatus Dormibacteraeota bacterium]
MPNKLRRYYGAGYLHFITTSCYRRMPLLAKLDLIVLLGTTSEDGTLTSISLEMGRDAMDIDQLVDDFAIRSFRDIADEDYISARMAFRGALAEPSLWASQQTAEKYLKCILLLNRIPGRHIRHKLGAALDAIRGSNLTFDLTLPTRQFIEHLDRFGPFRYLEISNVAYGLHLTNLDRCAWELRRYCTRSEVTKQLKLHQGVIPPKFRIEGGYLEAVIDNAKSPAREPLLWQNAFFGSRPRRYTKRDAWMKATNAPLYLNPQILDEILRYVHLPKHIIEGYRAHKQPQ